MRKCAICNSAVTRDDAPILTMGAYGTPRCLCDECDKSLAVATEGREYGEVVAAIEKIGERLSASDVTDMQSIATVKELLDSARERAELIKSGEYDFAADADDNEDAYEIPDELLETEEDRELDRADEERNRKFDKIFNLIAGVVIGAAAAFLIYRVLDAYLF